jgi:hypothetical protein
VRSTSDGNTTPSPRWKRRTLPPTRRQGTTPAFHHTHRSVPVLTAVQGCKLHRSLALSGIPDSAMLGSHSLRRPLAEQDRLPAFSPRPTNRRRRAVVRPSCLGAVPRRSPPSVVRQTRVDCTKPTVVRRDCGLPAVVSHSTSSPVHPIVADYYQILLKIRTVEVLGPRRRWGCAPADCGRLG